MAWNDGFGRIKEERKNMSFFKVFQSADLSSECMRALPYSFMKNISSKDFSYKMVIRAQWGSSWEVDISKNPRFYYMEKSGWSQFVSDNALGEDEFVTFTHKGLMRFDVNIYGVNCKEIVMPRKPPTTTPFRESSYREVKKEDETGESTEGVELEAKEKKAEGSKTSKEKKKKVKSETVVNSVEIGESSRGAGIKGRKKKAEKPEISMEKIIKSKKVKSDDVPGFKMTIRKSYLKFLAIPRVFEEAHMPNESIMYTVHHPKGKRSWDVLCLVRENRTIFSSGWSRLAREYPLSVGDRCTFKLIEPTEFVLISKKAKEDITLID